MNLTPDPLRAGHKPVDPTKLEQELTNLPAHSRSFLALSALATLSIHSDQGEKDPFKKLQIHPGTNFSQDFFNGFFSLFALASKLATLSRDLANADYSRMLHGLDTDSDLYKRLAAQAETRRALIKDSGTELIGSLVDKIDNLMTYPAFLKKLLSYAEEFSKIQPEELLRLVNREYTYFEKLISALRALDLKKDADPFSADTQRILLKMTRYVQLAGRHIYGRDTWKQIHGDKILRLPC